MALVAQGINGSNLIENDILQWWHCQVKTIVCNICTIYIKYHQNRMRWGKKNRSDNFKMSIILTFKYHMLDHFGSLRSFEIDFGFSRVKSRFCLDFAVCCFDHTTLLSSLRRLWWWCDGDIDRFAIDRCSIW